MSGRSRKLAKKYHRYVKSRTVGSCDFCVITKEDASFISETKSFKVINNIFPYSYWDLQLVADHLMVVPKKHTDTLSDLTAPEAVEYVDIISSYERRGYSIYTRTPSSNMKSVVHLHTHLIKTSGSPRRAVVFLKKPYIRFTI